MTRRITPSNITSLNSGEVFVFGSNESGMHGAGAAKLANEYFGAIYGVGFGPFYIMGTVKAFGIPTKDWNIKTLDIERVHFYIDRFIDYAECNPKYKFLVTQIGCGLAGYKPEQIAPLFRGAIGLENVYLPNEFWDVLDKPLKKYDQISMDI